jgi:hypothetical protein
MLGLRLFDERVSGSRAVEVEVEVRAGRGRETYGIL